MNGPLPPNRSPLAGKTVVVGICGSIAAVETVRLIHALRRRGATVRGVMTRAAAGIVHPDAITYACGAPVITSITGMVEHVAFCGDGGSASLFLIAPATANTLAKVALGIDDTPVTTFATTAIGAGIPVVVVPAMHHSMYRHPAVPVHLATLRSYGITVADPRIEEGKAKIAAVEDIVLIAERACGGSPLAGRKVLITSGPCREEVDDVRVLTTRSTGIMGRELALEAFRRGADVTVVHAGRVPLVRNVQVSTAADMHETVLSLLAEEGTDIYLSAAAISDFAPERFPGKMRSGEERTLLLRPLPKLIDAVLAGPRPLTIAFKAGGASGEGVEALLCKGAAVVVENPPSVMGRESGSFCIHSPAGKTRIQGSKEDAARAVWDAVLPLIMQSRGGT